MSIPDCCVSHFNQGESICPVCQSQRVEHENERKAAESNPVTSAQLPDGAADLVRRGVVSRGDVGVHTAPAKALSLRNPCRRQVFRLLGIYLPEREARELLKTVHDYKWIESEKAGFDLWSRKEEPLEEAARSWADKYLSKYLNHRSNDIAA